MGKYKICVLTATRAEFGLLRPVIEKLIQKNIFDVRIVVTGMHLSAEFGMTYHEIESAGFKIDRKIDMLLSGDSTAAVAKSMGVAMISFADYFAETKPDILLAIADRYETLAVCTTAMVERIPIVHLMGGETSEGAIDECIRHSITKMSALHFCCTEEYRKRIIQLGENPDTVFNVGSTGVENIKKLDLFDESKIRNFLGLDVDEKYAVMTFHPVTLENDTADGQINQLLAACADRKDITFIVTKANCDAAGRLVNERVAEYAETHKNIRLYDSLGNIRYLSAVKYADFVIGNSSSGLLEAPSFKIPTINIGDRQKGRMRADSVIDTDNDTRSILEAIEKAENSEFRISLKDVKNPYEGRNTSTEIADGIEKALMEKKIHLKKTFYNLQF